MAKCEAREIKVSPPPMEYVLTLNAAEAALVKHLVAGACMSNRDALDDVNAEAIWKALHYVVVPLEQDVAYSVNRRRKGE